MKAYQADIAKFTDADTQILGISVDSIPALKHWSEELAPNRGYITTPQVSEIRSSLARFFATPRQTTEQRGELSTWAWNRFAWDRLIPAYLAFYESVSRRCAET